MTILIVAPVMAATTGIIVSSIPSGASIYLDPSNSNDGYKGTTPQLITGLTTGSHYLRLTLEGYADATQSVNLSSNSPTWVTITMPSTPSATGSIKVSSFPSGANIYLDGTYTGTTPYTITDVPVGSHDVELTKLGYGNVIKIVNVSSGFQSLVFVSLFVTLPSTGSIKVSSVPSGANIYLDDTYAGTTPYTITGVSIGSHAVKLTLSGYGDVIQTVPVYYGLTTSVFVTLPVTLPSPTGSINVISIPSGANIYLDGTYAGITPHTITGVTEGDHDVELTKFGYGNVKKTVTVSSGSTVQVIVTLQRSTPKDPIISKL